MIVIINTKLSFLIIAQAFSRRYPFSAGPLVQNVFIYISLHFHFNLNVQCVFKHSTGRFTGRWWKLGVWELMGAGLPMPQPLPSPLPVFFWWQQLPSAARNNDHQQRRQHHDDCHLSGFSAEFSLLAVFFSFSDSFFFNHWKRQQFSPPPCVGGQLFVATL